MKNVARCSICGRDVRPRAENPAYPFCSPPCKLVDLGRWLDGGYRIPGPPGEVSELGDDPDRSDPRARRGGKSEDDE